ncbi:MAG: hypothetical protein R6X08_04085 [Desulfosalsimonadaceae bacterium]
MDRIITQIYEIQTPQEAEEAAACGVDHIGSVVLSEKDWKQPRLYQTVRTAAERGVTSSLIVLFSSRDAVFAALNYYRPDIVHFCEDITPQGAMGREKVKFLVDLQQQVRQRFPHIRIMRSIPIVRTGAQQKSPVLELAAPFEPVSDYFLTDTLVPDAAVQPVDGFVGITGDVCCWQTAQKLAAASRIPVILAGGLSPENVFEAVTSVQPAGVDSCSRTNALDNAGRPLRFQKDWEKVRQFVSEARRAEKQLREHIRH